MSRQTKIFLFLLAFAIIILPISLTHASNRAYAFDSEQSMDEIVYKQILIQKGDTLTTIAEEYYDHSYGTFSDYVSEISTLNGLKNNDAIHSGNYLIIPVKEVR
jgi:N-acetylmuramoyl-L-alanine amidase